MNAALDSKSVHVARRRLARSLPPEANRIKRRNRLESLQSTLSTEMFQERTEQGASSSR